MLPPPVGEFVDANGRRLWCRSAGAGAPSVVFVPAAGMVGLDYALVADAVSKVTTSVLYDRAGTGFSDPARLPRSADDVADELRDALQLLRVPTPYVLVGHSLGCLYVRRFVERNPGDVAGVVLLDPEHEKHDAYTPPELVEIRQGIDEAIEARDEELPESVRDFCRWLYASVVEGLPPLLRDTLVEVHSSPELLDAALREFSGRPTLYHRMSPDAPLPDVPTKILSSTEIDVFTRARHHGGSEELLQAEIRSKNRLYVDLVAPLTNAEVRPVSSGTATMPFHQPGGIAQAVLDLVGIA